MYPDTDRSVHGSPFKPGPISYLLPVKPLHPKELLVGDLKYQISDLPNYNFANGPVKTALTFIPRSSQNRATVFTVLSPTGMDLLLFQHLRQPYSWPGFESAKPWGEQD